jgi:hypothetical protein
MSDNPLRQKLLKLAEDLIDAVNGEVKAPIEDRIDVLKASTTLYLGDEKLSAKTPDDEPGGRSMRDWAREIRGEPVDA